MSETKELERRFKSPPEDVMGELISMLKLFDIEPEELFFKWESYVLSMGTDDIKLTLETARALKKYCQNQLEKEMREKTRNQNASVHRTPRTAVKIEPIGEFDLFGGGGLTPGTPSGVKRKVGGGAEKYGTPTRKTYRVADTGVVPPMMSSPMAFKTPSKSKMGGGDPPPETVTPFKTRTNAGETVEVLNPQIKKPQLPPPEDAATFDQRIMLQFNTELKKFAFRPMYQKIAEASEVQDERIDEFAAAIQEHYNLADEEFGDPSVPSQDSIVAVGRIVSDALEGRFNPQSVMIESSRMTGGGARTPLKLENIKSFSFFPGQIIGLRGTNSSGNYFAVSQILELPHLPPASSSREALAIIGERLENRPVSIFIASGPYTTEDNLLFESLDAICEKAAEQCPDAVILTGPFIDSDHPLVRDGDYDVEGIEFVTPEDLFRAVISPKIRKITKSMVIMIPCQRDAVSKHPVYPQEHLKRRALDLPINVKSLPNPSIFSLNELSFAVSTADVLFHLFRDEISRSPSESNPPARLTSHVLNQRNFYPLFPPPAHESLPVGVMPMSLDIPHFRLADLVNVTPDVLVLPSSLSPFLKVVDGVVAVNPGSLSKRRGAGQYVEVTVAPPDEEGLVKTEGEEVENVAHRVYKRARVEVVKI